MALSRRFAAEPNTALVLSDVAEESLASSVEAVKGSESPVATTLADVSNFDAVQAVVQLAVEKFGRLDALISNAGILSPNGRIHNLTTEDWERSFQVNLLGAVNAIRGRGGRDADTAIRLDHPHGIGGGSDRVVALRPLLRDQGRSDPAGESGGGRIRTRWHQGELRVSRDVPFGDPRGPSGRGPRYDCGAAPARTWRGGGSRRRIFVSSKRRLALDDWGCARRRRRLRGPVTRAQFSPDDDFVMPCMKISAKGFATETAASRPPGLSHR